MSAEDNPQRPGGVAAIDAALRRFFRSLWNRRDRKFPWVRRTFVVAIIAIVIAPTILIMIYRFVPPPFTPLMIGTAIEDGVVHQNWVPLEKISPYLVRAVVAAEDERFCTHSGFDWAAIERALKHNERNKRLRGASTISQQTAKNLFLTPARNWVRKGAEAWLTVLIEALWPKRRILETYLNVVEWGHRRFGAEAAARGYFGKPASRLNAMEAVRLAAVLPSPDRWRVHAPGPYVASRTDTLIWRVAGVSRDALSACVYR
ncbi:MAG: monofunctional biosynthetic peptidoglycan transglycosylase [Alphaproteobacteria bacterium]